MNTNLYQDQKPFDKYHYYMLSVQSPDVDVKFYQQTYRDFYGTEPVALREDFCGTFKICCEWTKLGQDKKAIGVDLDPEPIAYGKAKHFSELTEEQQSRVEVFNQDVMELKNPKADIVAAVNFSYFIFKERHKMVEYYKNIYESLHDKGLFILDIFGGSDIHENLEEETEYEEERFSYFWDQESFDSITHEATFHIHFQRKGEKKREKVFSYDWRIWSIPEIRDILKDAGFTSTHVYWEGTDEDGEGDGEYKKTESTDESCEGFVAYVVGVK